MICPIVCSFLPRYPGWLNHPNWREQTLANPGYCSELKHHQIILIQLWAYHSKQRESYQSCRTVYDHFFCNWIKDLTMNQAGRALRHLNMFSYVFWEKWVILSCPLNSTGAGWNAWNTPMPFCDMLRMKMMKSEGPGAFFAGAIPRCVQDWGWVGTSHSRF